MIGIDTNLLVYAERRSADARHDRAIAIIEVLMTSRRMFLPLQALGELYHVLRRKNLLEPARAAAIVESYLEVAEVQPYHPIDVSAAMKAVAAHRLSFRDALIWAVCERTAVPVLLSEDMQDGRTLGHVTFVNPFGERATALLQM